MRFRPDPILRFSRWMLPGVLVCALALALLSPCPAEGRSAREDLAFFAGLGDRYTGSPGAEAASEYIEKAFEEAGLQEVSYQEFLTPVPQVMNAVLEAEGASVRLFPWGPNLVYLPVTPADGLSGKLVYVRNGNFAQFDGEAIQGSIVLMDMDSRENWLTASMLGASALIFLGDPESGNGEFLDKETPTPVAFPRFWVPRAEGERLKSLAGTPRVTIRSDARWSNKPVRNCYGLVPGKDPELKRQIVVVDAFYDASSHILGSAPGADESTSIVALLAVARQLAKNPPDRSVLFLATVGNGQGLAGSRQFVWSIAARKKHLRRDAKELADRKKLVTQKLELLRGDDPLAVTEEADRELVAQMLVESAKDTSDAMSRELTYSRISANPAEATVTLEDIRPYRRISWITDLNELKPDQKELARKLLKQSIPNLRKTRSELDIRIRTARSSNNLRNLLDEYTAVLYLNLYLSSHSGNVGLVEMGETYPVRETVRKLSRANRLDDILNQVAIQTTASTGLRNMVRSNSQWGAMDSMGRQVSQVHPCCDIGAIAGLPSVSLMSLDDQRFYWSTPNDTIEHMDLANVDRLCDFLPPLFGALFSHRMLHQGLESGITGWASLDGYAKFMRQGELFADQPAPGTIVSVLQGDTVFRGMAFQDGSFFIPGLANSRVSLDKLIVEAFTLNPDTGQIAAAIDKVKTGKVNYRIKVKTDLATTTLIMFPCEQTDIPAVFGPQNLGYLPKVTLLDAVTEAPPLRYSYSRIDGRDTMAFSVFMERGSRFKLILSESLLTKDLFLINASKEHPTGTGFPVGRPLLMAPLQTARDLHFLVGDRLDNLTSHGIANKHLEQLYANAEELLNKASQALSENRVSAFWTAVVPSWGILDSIYGEIESTQRDVLAGVMFFIALFVPFAYCMERYAFGFRNVYKQIVAFFGFLIATILVIRSLHPAFELTYSPMVVILAFFIVGLSVMVSWIIFMRFETEMAEHHNQASGLRTPQVSKWQSFGAGFAIGVSNLGRRRLRTALTCVTLVILTFTVMSFTNVKSLHGTTRTRLADTAAYRGILLRHQFWLTLTDTTLDYLRAAFSGSVENILPRGWIDPANPGDRTVAFIEGNNLRIPLEGVLGMGQQVPSLYREALMSGDWFSDGDPNGILLPAPLALELKLDPAKDVGVKVNLKGMEFTVKGYLDAKRFEALKDLDQNPVTPAYLELSSNEEMTEVEAEAIQSGEQILPQTERFRYAGPDRTVIIPFKRCRELGGNLKSASILVPEKADPLTVADALSSWLSYPLFIGDDATWYHSASSSLRYQGVANLIIPILIVVFITLNTMIGHVHERKREIATYTSVGLAPTHVGFLFIVEALSLAVLSTVIGYILAQVSARYLASSPMFSQLTFNYSSMASVACMFLVFSVVFLAALYPARLAAEIAMPDVNRSWDLPVPEGDSLFMHLPFLLKFDEQTGIMGFLNSFYSSYQDMAGGSFLVDETNLDTALPETRHGEMALPTCLLLRAKVWLAPFDFGIKQRLQLYCCPSDDNPGYLEIAILLVRLSGERSAWIRANRNFIRDLRKQMLVWRLLSEDTKASYAKLV